MNAGDSYRIAVEPQSPRRVPASSRLPRGFCAWFLLQISTMGNFTASNQPHISPGLTDSPQADTARPAARESFNTTHSLYLLPDGHRFTEYLDKNAGNTFPAFPPYPLSYRRPFQLGRMFADIFAWHPPDTCRLSRSVSFLSAYAETHSFPRYCEKHIWLP